jgi:hypothetical protein
MTSDLMASTLERAPDAPSPAAGGRGGDARRDGPMVGTVVGLVVVVAGALIGAQPLQDNSFLTHLATGRLMLAEGLPTADPYSATALGEPWVVQSWLASLLYGTVDAVAGPIGLRLLMAVTTAMLAWLVWRLADPATSLVPRLAIMAAALGIGLGSWAERPLLFGLIGVAIALLAAEGRVDHRWMVPLFWLWANVHGSFPLGLLVVATWWLGSRWSDRAGDAERRVLAWSAMGVLAAAISPLGPRILFFPVQMLARSETLSEITEWKSPDFATTPARLFLLLAVGAVVVLARRPDRRDALMTVLALGLGLMATRNLAVASIILVPVVARGVGPVGSMRVDDRAPVLRVALAAVAVLGLIAMSSTLQKPDYALAAYPVRALAWLESQDLVGERQAMIATRDYAGNLQTVLYGPEAGVFLDDRYDLYPTDLTEDYVSLLRGAGWQDVLDRRGVDVVLWDRGTQLADLVAASPDWGVVYGEDRWLVACRRPTPDSPAVC